MHQKNHHIPIRGVIKQKATANAAAFCRKLCYFFACRTRKGITATFRAYLLRYNANNYLLATAALQNSSSWFHLFQTHF